MEAYDKQQFVVLEDGKLDIYIDDHAASLPDKGRDVNIRWTLS